MLLREIDCAEAVNANPLAEARVIHFGGATFSLKSGPGVIC